MRIPALVFLLIALLLAVPLAVWLYTPAPLPVYAQTISITLIDEGAEGINFGNVNPGTEDNGDVDQGDGTPAVQVEVESETASVNISIRGETTDSLPLGEWEYSTNFTNTKVPLSSTYVVVYNDVSSNATYDFYHWVDVPGGTTAGSYNCTIYYKAVELP